MAYKASTGLLNFIMASGSFKEALELGFIKVYDGTPPASPDMAATGNLICVISNNGTGTGLTFSAAASSGTLTKNPSEVWKGTALSPGGTATYFRFVENADDGTASTTQKRLQGTVGASGTDWEMTNPNFVTGADQTVDSGTYTLPGF